MNIQYKARRSVEYKLIVPDLIGVFVGAEIHVLEEDVADLAMQCE